VHRPNSQENLTKTGLQGMPPTLFLGGHERFPWHTQTKAISKVCDDGILMPIHYVSGHYPLSCFSIKTRQWIRFTNIIFVEAVLPDHVVGMELNLSCLHADAVHIPGFVGGH
jgi:hypothetical protein